MFRDLARSKQCLSDEAIKALLRQEKRGVLALHGENGYPYCLPINYWYDEEGGRICFHSGKKGHKLDALRRDDRACFCVFDEGWQREGEWARNVSSVILFGRMVEITDRDEIVRICRRLSMKFTSDEAYIEHELETFASATLCLALIPEHICGKAVNES